MNEINVKITNCHDCKCCEHNGLIQDEADIRYVCHHRALFNSELHDGEETWNTINGIKYWYGLPILAKYNSNIGMVYQY